jgi:KaiC/GvpD/RAD55 family RecA-like ATPase
LENRVKSGITGFDLLVSGGIPSAHSVLLQSPSTQETNVFTNQFIKKGLENFEPVLVVLSKTTPQKFRESLRSIGINAKKYEESGYLTIVDWYSFKTGEAVSDVEERGRVICASKDLTHIGIAISRGIKKLQKAPVVRAIFDILSQAMNFFEFKRTYNFVQAMVARSRRNNITSIFPMETVGADDKTLSALHAIFDGVIDIKVQRVGDRITRRIGILAMSGVHYDSRYRPLRLEDNEMIVGEKKKKTPPEVMIKEEPEITTPAKKTPKLPKKVEDEIKSKIKVVKADPDNADLWFSLGSTLLTYEKYEDAVRAFDKVIELDPEFTRIWNLKAEALQGLGRDDEAAECLKKSVEVSIKQMDQDIEIPLMQDLEKELKDILDEVEEVLPTDLAVEDVMEFTCPNCGATTRSGDLQCSA